MLDVACGQGLATRVLAAAGAHRVVGTDLSDAMIAIALRHRDPAGASDISYVVDDAQQLQAFDDNAFDGLTCQLGLMNIPELHAAPKAICVGTCAVYRRAALEENGGATLIEHSETTVNKNNGRNSQIHGVEIASQN